MKVTTFDGDQNNVEAVLVSGPSATGLCKVKIGDRTLVRHRDRLTPADDEAKKMFGTANWLMP